MFSPIVAALLALLLFSCGDNGDTINYSPDAGNEVGSVSQPWMMRKSATGARTWGVRQNTGDACVHTGSSFNCYMIGEHVNDHAIVFYVSGTACDWGCGSYKATLEADIDLFISNIGASIPGAKIPWSFQRVTSASTANVIIEPTTAAAPYCAHVGCFIGAQWDTSKCVALLESPSINNTYWICNKNFTADPAVRIKYDAPALSFYTAQQGYSGSAQVQARRQTVFSALLAVTGIGHQTSNTTVVSYPFLSPNASLNFLSGEENCRFKNLSRDEFSDPNDVGSDYMRLYTATCS